MKKLLAVQISVFILISGTLGGLLAFTDVYDTVQSNIVSLLCLSCIKLDPKTQLDFIFETANGQQHPDFMLDNLTKGPVFLEFREDVCTACDIMAPVVKEIFSVEFEKDETFATTVAFGTTNVTFIHINLDHATEELKDSISVYDKDHVGGVPMFTILTLGYDRGFIKPYYTTAYGTLSLDSNEERKELLLQIIQDGIDLYNQNHAGHSTG